MTLHPTFSATLRRGSLLLTLLAGLLSFTGFAQTAAPAPATTLTYDFLTVTSSESSARTVSVVLIAPPFQGKSEIQLEAFGGIYNARNRERVQRNTVLINQQLTELTAAGWELFQVYPQNYPPDLLTTRYLFRKVRR